RGEFLPHDVAFLAMTPRELCAVNECRVVHFMIHDRVAFGGSLIAIGVMYLWLVSGPIARGKWWAWGGLAAGGAGGVGGLLADVGYGYLDSWHGVATAVLAPLFLLGLVVARRQIAWGASARGWLARPSWLTERRDRRCIGNVFLLFVSAG